MFKKLIPLVAVPLALLAPSLAHAGETRTLAVSATTTSVTTLEDTVIDFTYTCNGWASGGTVQFFIQGGTPTNIGDPITIPNIALTSFQFTGSITYAFPTAGTYVVDAKVVGTVDGGAGSSCDIATVNSGTAVTFTVADVTTTTTIENGMPIAQTGADTSAVAIVALLMLASGGLLVVRRRIS